MLNDQHVIARNHNVDREEAISFIKNAVVTVVWWNGKRKLYFSESGAAYVAHEEKTIETAFRSSEYDDKTKKLMEVIVNALSSRK